MNLGLTEFGLFMAALIAGVLFARAAKAGKPRKQVLPYGLALLLLAFATFMAIWVLPIDRGSSSFEGTALLSIVFSLGMLCVAVLALRTYYRKRDRDGNPRDHVPTRKLPPEKAAKVRLARQLASGVTIVVLYFTPLTTFVQIAIVLLAWVASEYYVARQHKGDISITDYLRSWF